MKTEAEREWDAEVAMETDRQIRTGKPPYGAAATACEIVAKRRQTAAIAHMDKEAPDA